MFWIVFTGSLRAMGFNTMIGRRSAMPKCSFNDLTVEQCFHLAFPLL